MSCCPSVRARNTGSGYTKCESSTNSTETTKALNDLLAARAAQDALIWGKTTAAPAATKSQIHNFVGSAGRVSEKLKDGAPREG
jgi:hypothetical protein